ncbi:hypothetical protein BGZ65_004174 [Modicella reniformis]|uniref:Band 7 domain-containing protein n=1 Tax=Modicella reniformis TaxID=1440133 RepID=A0A9P6SLT8_9FUNG|nr:hypothetical protein BGZ65_004174 [Modicella reniformis]
MLRTITAKTPRVSPLVATAASATLRTTRLHQGFSAPSALVLRRSYASRYGDEGYSNWGGGGISRRSLPMNTASILQIMKFVPQQEAWIVERMGRFSRVLEPGLQILMPFLDRVKYVKSLKEVAIEIPSQSAITQGNQIRRLYRQVV